MAYALAALGLLALGEAAVLWYLWTKWRSALRDGDVADGVAAGLQVQLVASYSDLAAARAALAKQNDLEAKADASTVAAHPDLDAALARINQL